MRGVIRADIYLADILRASSCLGFFSTPHKIRFPLRFRRRGGRRVWFLGLGSCLLVPATTSHLLSVAGERRLLNPERKPDRRAPPKVVFPIQFPVLEVQNITNKHRTSNNQPETEWGLRCSEGKTPLGATIKLLSNEVIASRRREVEGGQVS